MERSTHNSHFYWIILLFLNNPILLVWAIGSGKSTAALAIKDFWYTIKSVSELLGEDISPERKHERADFMRALSELATLKWNWYAGEIAVDYAKTHWNNVIFDGFRRPEEIEYFKKHFPESIVIWIIAPYSVMVERVLSRERDIDKDTCPEKDVLKDLWVLPGYSSNPWSQNVLGCLEMCHFKLLSYWLSKSDFSDLVKVTLQPLITSE